MQKKTQIWPEATREEHYNNARLTPQAQHTKSHHGPETTWREPLLLLSHCSVGRRAANSSLGPTAGKAIGHNSWMYCQRTAHSHSVPKMWQTIAHPPQNFRNVTVRRRRDAKANSSGFRCRAKGRARFVDHVKFWWFRGFSTFFCRFLLKYTFARTFLWK